MLWWREKVLLHVIKTFSSGNEFSCSLSHLSHHYATTCHYQMVCFSEKNCAESMCLYHFSHSGFWYNVLVSCLVLWASCDRTRLPFSVTDSIMQAFCEMCAQHIMALILPLWARRLLLPNGRFWSEQGILQLPLLY